MCQPLIELVKITTAVNEEGNHNMRLTLPFNVTGYSLEQNGLCVVNPTEAVVEYNRKHPTRKVNSSTMFLLPNCLVPQIRNLSRRWDSVQGSDGAIYIPQILPGEAHLLLRSTIEDELNRDSGLVGYRLSELKMKLGTGNSGVYSYQATLAPNNGADSAGLTIGLNDRQYHLLNDALEKGHSPTTMVCFVPELRIRRKRA